MYRPTLCCYFSQHVQAPPGSILRLFTKHDLREYVFNNTALEDQRNLRTRGNEFRPQKLRSDMTYITLVFPIGWYWLIHGIIYLTGFLLIPLTHLKLDWIYFGTVKILYMISQHSCREPEVVVKCCVRNFSNLVYCKVISRCGHRGFGLRS